MTLEEMERRAYADGDVTTAALIHRMDDIESDMVTDLLDEIELLKDKIFELEGQK